MSGLGNQPENSRAICITKCTCACHVCTWNDSLGLDFSALASIWLAKSPGAPTVGEDCAGGWLGGGAWAMAGGACGLSTAGEPVLRAAVGVRMLDRDVVSVDAGGAFAAPF